MLSPTTRFARLAICLLLAAPVARMVAQLPASAFHFTTDGPALTAEANPLKPFTVAGYRGVILGQQDGTFEAWVNPIKLLSNFRITANVENYKYPIDVNAHPASIEVRPDRTIITYTHIAFNVREIIFSPAALNDPESPHQPTTGPVVLFEFQTLHPTEFVFSFTPEMRWMWPRANNGIPSAEWVTPAGSISNSSLSAGQSNADLNAANSLGGYYILHTDVPDFAGALTIPGATSGIMEPYQERPEVHAVELHLHIDPKRDSGKLFPLLMAVGTTKDEATTTALGARLAHLNAQLPDLYDTHARAWAGKLAHLTTIHTPDKNLDQAFTWAEISIEQLRTHAFTTANNNTGETGLVAGYYQSGDSARPGFGWFFGRDSLYSLYALNSIGDFQLSRDELEFLINRQRADGKIMHEYSQTAPMVDWASYPYEYAAADSTPLFLLASEDYIRHSNDLDYLHKYEAAINLAWDFERTHDSDGDGIYDNSQGTGWVESWPGGMPHQEIYLALLDEQASIAYARMMDLLKIPVAATDARKRAAAIHATIEREYYDQEKGCYAFSYNADKGVDRTRTVYPSLAWWSRWDGEMDSGNMKPAEKILPLAHSDDCLRQFASQNLDTDWGLRDIAGDEPIYNGMSYHQGSVWPLFTGWAALAEFRGGQPLAGYQMLMQNARLTTISDLGADTELLSGDFNVPFGRSTSHQMWSSAMVIIPALRGLFGIDINTASKTITVNPQLPAEWTHAVIENLQLPDGSVSINFTKENDKPVATFQQGNHARHEWKMIDLSNNPKH